MALESGGLSAAPSSFPSRAVRAVPTLSQLRLLGFRVPKLSWAGADCRHGRMSRGVFDNNEIH